MTSTPDPGEAVARAELQWQAGEWAALAGTDLPAIENRAARARVAARAADALLQLGRADAAGTVLRQAFEWGADRHEVARTLAAGLHNTLGRIAALKGDDAAMRGHFGQALQPSQASDPAAAVEHRTLRELASLGLLREGHARVRAGLAAIDNRAVRPALVAARVEMLRSEVALLQHELALAQKRARAPEPGASGVDAWQQHLRRRATSQLGQDLWVLERSGFKRNGFFVEFGATDGVRLSNTWLLETEFGWSGICAEPNPKMFAQLRENRRCTTTDACIGPRSGDTVEFVLAEEYGGFVSDMSHDLNGPKREAYYSDEANRCTFVTESLHDLLVRLGAPREIDYLSIDTEGSEHAILAAFPFDQWNVRRLTVEHNNTERRARLRELLEPLGYRCTEAQWDDWYERPG